MIATETKSPAHLVMGQKYAYATMSLILGISCFFNFAGLEKAILAIVFARLALKADPPPLLQERRAWAKAGLALGMMLLILVPTVLLLNLDRLHSMLDALSRLSNGK